MTAQDTGNQGWLFRGWRGVLLGMLAVVGSLVSLSLAFDQARLAGWFGMAGQGHIGLESAPIPGRPGWERISQVTPLGAAERAGLGVGVAIRFDHPIEAHADFSVGRVIGLVVDPRSLAQGRAPLHLALKALSQSTPLLADRIKIGTVVFAAWLSVALAILAFMRGWGSPGALAFGLGMISYIISSSPPSWVIDPALALVFVWVGAIFRSGIFALLALPAVIYAEHIASPGRGWTFAFAALGLGTMACNLFQAWCAVTDTVFPVIGDGGVPMLVLIIITLVTGLFWAWRGQRDAAIVDHRRFVALFATLVVMTAVPVINVVLNLTRVLDGQFIGQIAPFVLSNIFIPLLLAYAVLRHRVIDLSFAINRTLVYATVSVILLGSFGLIEWGVEHLLPEDWVKASAWIDAGAAVLVYLAFHRVHDWVETRVEHVFFHHWQANEQALREFVGTAAHFEDAGALARAFADELARFGGGAPVALYRRSEGVLTRVGGDWAGAPRHFRDDNRAFARLRETRVPLDLTEAGGDDLPGVLALPMLDHGVLAGLALLDAKPGGLLYRPDEIALLGWAAHEVGLALAALHAGRIESENRLLRAQLARLTGIIGDRMATATG